MKRFARYLHLEQGLLLGGALLLAGFVTAGFAVFRWWQAGLGDLDPQNTMRLVIISSLLLAMGTQICFSSFFLSILGLQRRGEHGD